MAMRAKNTIIILCNRKVLLHIVRVGTMSKSEQEIVSMEKEKEKKEEGKSKIDHVKGILWIVFAFGCLFIVLILIVISYWSSSSSSSSDSGSSAAE